MIHTDEELTVVRKQLQRIEDALAALRRDVLPKNPNTYNLLAEGYLDQIAALQSEISAYPGGRADAHPARTPPAEFSPCDTRGSVRLPDRL